MGDIGAEPSMEDILSSIKRIIAEEGDGGQPRPRRAPRAATTVDRRAAPMADDHDQGRADAHDDHSNDGAERVSEGRAADEPILELSDPMPDPDWPRDRARADAAKPEPILSLETAAASRGSLDSLSRLIVKQEPGSDGTLEGLVREMLRPMLRDWLDSNLPDLVETLVAREIAKITGQAR
ncbi:DUF2497 domain-containing protein [Sphingomonas oligophenolica]|uniref:DUF2497 domain-containing protein n=1 Tax=Sphingomonas oligophenolica TaxID=301154 RepID=A0A502C905_9SPHN|nr:DUF2497 domain-containing protein [Sphingomonas oligophenolica]TPG08489.1 DUF2497 domain-containing protein [Sphingomonas oligophenolica]